MARSSAARRDPGRNRRRYDLPPDPLRSRPPPLVPTARCVASPCLVCRSAVPGVSRPHEHTRSSRRASGIGVVAMATVIPECKPTAPDSGRGGGRQVPSSLIFAALAGAWLVVLVPMAAKRRQEVARTAESALAGRVLRRRDRSSAASQRDQEVAMIPGRVVQREPAVDERRYRAGRGGYDPEIAAQLAQAKYVFRQRVVLGLVIGS